MSKKFKLLQEVLKRTETRKSPIPSLNGVCEIMTSESEIMYAFTQKAKDAGIHLELAEKFKIEKSNQLICKQPEEIIIDAVAYKYIMFYKQKHKDKYFETPTTPILGAVNSNTKAVFL